ncbi:chondroitinase-B domain-containing protein [Pedobacter miscanthi]|uniref:chondroitinase-B domain-containing protein n=1 Tax=Pedobacter miscanthi TaxID=2259170 RepID=UPI00292DD983|nr:chondroitinase-B domain-containing protein [Pedobacter miscanthi]
MIQKLTICVLFFLIFIQKITAKVYHVGSEQEFKAIQPLLLAGDEVEIKNGNYTDWALNINTNATSAKPIIIRAEKPGMVIFSGNVNKPVFHISGDYILIKGVDFKNCILSKTGVLIELSTSNNCQVLNCNFSANQVKAQFTPLVIISGSGSNNMIEGCSFTSNIDNQDVQVRITKDSYPKFTLIENNIFRDKNKVSWANGNGGECVQIGQDPVLLGNQKPETTVRKNKFVHCNGENEVISNKSSGNKYLNNYFEDNDGELVMRGGHDCIIADNTFKGGTGGIRINGTGHQVINNKIDGIQTAIRLMYGMAKGKEEIGFYIAASDCVIKNNAISNAATGILIGDSKDADWTGKFDTKRYPSPVIQNVAPFSNTIVENTYKSVKVEVVKR